MSNTIRKTPRKTRNWIVVDARQRHTAGQMGDKRKKESREECRNWKHKGQNDVDS